MSERLKVMLDDGAYAPERAHKTDAGLDLRSPMNCKVRAGKWAIIDTGVHVEVPEGYVGMLKSKSGLNIKHGIQSEGVIDCGYTGSIVVKLYNHGDHDVQIRCGDKISQLVLQKIITPDIIIVSRMADTERGNNGFGSTGR